MRIRVLRTVARSAFCEIRSLHSTEATKPRFSSLSVGVLPPRRGRNPHLPQSDATTVPRTDGTTTRRCAIAWLLSLYPSSLWEKGIVGHVQSRNSIRRRITPSVSPKKRTFPVKCRDVVLVAVESKLPWWRRPRNSATVKSPGTSLEPTVDFWQTQLAFGDLRARAADHTRA